MQYPRRYLEEIYADALDVGSNALMDFYADVYRELEGKRLLEFGSGPTIYSAISAARTAGSIHFADACTACLEEVRMWRDNAPNAFDWSAFTVAALQHEAKYASAYRAESNDSREALLRSKISSIGVGDAFAPDLLPGAFPRTYGAVATNFCLDGISSDHRVWFDLNRRLCEFVADGGLYVTTAIRNGKFWGTGGENFAAVSLTLEDVLDAYGKLGLAIVCRREIDLAARAGYDGIVMVAGKKEMKAT